MVEFFLPASCVSHGEQQAVLSAISATMARNCRTLRTLRPDEVDPDMLDDSDEDEDDDEDLGRMKQDSLGLFDTRRFFSRKRV